MVPYEDVLEVWFGPRSAPPPADRFPLWFGASPPIDRMLRERFGEAVERAIAGDYESWKSTPPGRLALILLLDQLPRNIFRRTPRAFAGDPRALELAREGTAWGMDLGLRHVERLFFYLPFEHAEDRENQLRSVQLFRNLMDVSEGPMAKMVYVYALRHREILERFGRFPHRNRILGRATTEEEERFLLTPMSGF